MKPGKRVAMIFPGDTAPTHVLTTRIAEARARGAVLVNKPWAMKALDALPTVGGWGGGAAGVAVGAPALALGPAGALVPPTMGVAGAGIGGALGQGARELGYRAMGYGDAPGTIGKESEMQAKLQTLGSIGGKAAEATGYGLMGLATRVPARFKEGLRVAAEMAGAKNVEGIPGDLAGAHIKLRLPAGGTAVSRTEDMIDRTGLAKGRMVEHLQKAGVRISSADIVQPLGVLMNKVRRFKATSRDELRFLGDKLEEFLQNHGDSMEPEAVDLMKQMHQSLLKGHYASEIAQGAKGMSRSSGLVPYMETEWNKVIARGTRKALERAEPAIGAENAKESILKRIKEANVHIASKGSLTPGQALGLHALGTGAGLAAGAATGHSVMGSGVGLAATGLGHLGSMPQVQSRAALLLTDPAFQFLLKNSPRAAEAYLKMASQSSTPRPLGPSGTPAMPAAAPPDTSYLDQPALEDSTYGRKETAAERARRYYGGNR